MYIKVTLKSVLEPVCSFQAIVPTHWRVSVTLTDPILRVLNIVLLSQRQHSQVTIKLLMLLDTINVHDYVDYIEFMVRGNKKK